MARADKAGIYVDAYKLFDTLYRAQFEMPKRDRCVIAPRLLEHTERLISEFAMAYNTDDKLTHIERMLAEYECLKIDCRFTTDNKLVKDDTEREIKEYIVRISEGIDKWRGYVVSKIGKQ